MKKQYFYLLLAISFIFSCNVSIDENAAKSVAKSVTEGVKEGMGENEESYEEVEGLEGLSPVEQLGQGKDIEDINYGPKMGYDKSKARINISKEEDESTGVGSSQGAMMGKVELKKDQPYEILQNSCNQFLNQQGKSLYGINSDGSIYSVQAAQTGRPSNQNSSNFIESRYIAYRKAELLAKIDILSLLAGASLTSSAAFSEIAQELGEYAQFDEEDLSLDEEFSVESFAEHIAANFAGLLMGCNVVKMAEGDLGDNDYQVAVCIN